MSQPYYETFHEISEMGIHIAYHTVPGGYHPLHWHEELEILYPLNGETDITVEGQKYRIPRQNVLVVNPRQLHSSYYHGAACMFLCIHISEKLLKKYMPDIELYHIHCCPEAIDEEQLPAYREICGKLEELTKLYIREPAAASVESEGLTLQILALLIRHFSVRTAAPELTQVSPLTSRRLREIVTYVEEHFREPVSLSGIADHLGLSREYFCRFFRQNMGTSFLRYVNEVRVAHIYQDLLRTDTPVADLAEENGFTNQKLFNRIFKEIYGCTPSSVRKTKAES
ncbi:MAG: AraC family transcriptional regulator [Lachnospiraceae bacterium]|nr:AraC family transcriptional regulator [Lachnospiraceae bacterium]